MNRVSSKFIPEDKTFIDLVKNKKIFIFDLDGTIANTELIHWKAYNELLKEHNVKLLPQNIQKYIGHKEVDIYAMIQKDFSITFDEKEFLEKRLKIFFELVEKDNLQPYPFINRILEKYNKEFAFLIVSSQEKNVVDRLFTKWKLDSYFPKDYRFCLSKGDIKKNDIYRDINIYLNKKDIKYEDIVVFEDSEHYLIKAKELGITTIGVEHQYNIGKIKSCDLIVTSDE